VGMDARAGVAERWISSQAAGTTTPTNPSLSQSNSPKASANPSPKGPSAAGAAAWTNKSPPSASLGAPVASAIPLMSSSYNFGSALGESSLGSLSAFGGPAGVGAGGGAAALSSPFPQSASSGGFCGKAFSFLPPFSFARFLYTRMNCTKR
jgi:hypothetical protein